MARFDISLALNAVAVEAQTERLLETNQKSARYGLMLTAETARELIEARNDFLQSYGRVELDMEATRRLIESFCDSPFIDQEDYGATLKELQELFYYLKNETDDEIGDAELIALLKEWFENACGGSLELLRGEELETFVTGFKRKYLLGCVLPEGDE